MIICTVVVLAWRGIWFSYICKHSEGDPYKVRTCEVATCGSCFRRTRHLPDRIVGCKYEGLTMLILGSNVDGQIVP
jgi:hypothetical protein